MVQQNCSLVCKRWNRIWHFPFRSGHRVTEWANRNGFVLPPTQPLWNRFATPSRDDGAVCWMRSFEQLFGEPNSVFYNTASAQSILGSVFHLDEEQASAFRDGWLMVWTLAAVSQFACVLEFLVRRTRVRIVGTSEQVQVTGAFDRFDANPAYLIALRGAESCHTLYTGDSIRIDGYLTKSTFDFRIRASQVCENAVDVSLKSAIQREWIRHESDRSEDEAFWSMIALVLRG